MNELKIFDETRNTNIKSTVFTDGMVVNAGDLDTAMRYPIELWQTLINAYFGCGIVCGLEVHRDPNGSDKTCCVRIEPGIALDCHGNPLQLCDSEKIDLTPDPCASEPWPESVCIAIRRDTMPEAPRKDGDDCDDNGKTSCQYRRERELVRIKVFKPDELPKTLCALPETYSGSVKEEQSVCECLKTCHYWSCCGEAWVLLACVKIDLEECDVEVDDSRRKYIKPIECICKLDERLKYIEEYLEVSALNQKAVRNLAQSKTSELKGKTE